MVENHQIGTFGLFNNANFFELAGTHKKSGSGRTPMSCHQCNRFATRGGHQLLKLLSVKRLTAIIYGELN